MKIDLDVSERIDRVVIREIERRGFPLKKRR